MKKLFLKAWLLAGTLDISAAFLQYYLKTGKSPVMVLNYIASAVFGNEAFNGGTAIAVTGLILHYCVAFLFTLFFFGLTLKFPKLLQSKVITAVIYGAFMWAVMQYLVLPLTKVPLKAPTLPGALTAISILIICISTPLIVMLNKRQTKKT